MNSNTADAVSVSGDYRTTAVLLKSTGPVKKALKGQTTLTSVFVSQLPQSSARAMALMRDTAVFCFFYFSSFGNIFCGGKVD